MPETLVDRTCRRCGRAFRVTLRRFNRQRKLFGEGGASLCSKACVADPSKYEDRTCRTCSRVFRFLLAAARPRNPGLYCSKACIPIRIGKVTETCPLCQRSFSYYLSTYASAGRPPPQTCGWKCPARKPTDERIKRVSRPAWRRRRREAIARDGGRCQRCGTEPTSPVVHHIVAWAKTHDDSLENLITLCRPCQALVEGFAEGSGQPGWDTHCRAS